MTKGFDARLANRPFLVYNFWALWHLTEIGQLAIVASNLRIIMQLFWEQWAKVG